ncbi:alanine--tRNA ligase [PVC group bacterium (ex Bugula neritina AB1)]|nr:alanine--tRNA ligase [PVC group bacterium (ex Bugula neritina AB1)]
MKSFDLRKLYVNFFKEKGHTHVASDHLVPHKDPTLLFTTAGMVPFKPLYMGAPTDYTRAVSIQKCLRAGGKGGDLELVGKTLRHHTFFEMLGNFSFGDYFKEEAICWAWDFFTSVLNLPVDKLWVSVYKDDEESAKIWINKVGFPKERICYLGDADNFWGPAGQSGACGPCSEIHIDLGEKRDPSVKEGDLENGGERYLELWNLVFPQFDQLENGDRQPLPCPGIDTGMGLERLTFVMQHLEKGIQNNYQTDLFEPLIEELSRLSGINYSHKVETDNFMHAIVDHVRALTFCLAEDLMPSNEGRGYVLRRILRRAYRFGEKINLREPFLHQLVPCVVDIMKGAYPDLIDVQKRVEDIILLEEQGFQKTLDQCGAFLEDIFKKNEDTRRLSGPVIFKLYDTYGFPIDMLSDIALEKDFSLDLDSFKSLMNDQKKRARQGWTGEKKADILKKMSEVFSDHGETIFLGYENLEAEAKVLAVIKDLSEKQTYIVTDETPFYAESGGQAGDKGFVTFNGNKYEVCDTKQIVEGISSHICSEEIDIPEGSIVTLEIDKKRRLKLMNNHTATHLLQSALKKELGEDIRQAGSLVEEHHLRFDFNYMGSIPIDVLRVIEKKVNNIIWSNIAVGTQKTSLSEAKKEGALSFFNEKYGDLVRVVSVADFSKELCGGTHVLSTGDIGFFKILSESSVAAGIRRITAVTGEDAMSKFYEYEKQVLDLKHLLKVEPSRIFETVGDLQKKLKDSESALKKMSLQKVLSDVRPLEDDVFSYKEMSVWAKVIDLQDKDALKSFHDAIRARKPEWVLLIFANVKGKAQIIVSVPENGVKLGWHAGRIVKALAKHAGGGGGGKPNVAQAGCKDVKYFPTLLKDFKTITLEAFSA